METGTLRARPWDDTGNENRAVRDTRACGSFCSDVLPLNATILSEKLSRANYTCHFIGKGHLGYQTMDHLPINRGFQTHVGFLAGSEDYRYGGGSVRPPILPFSTEHSGYSDRVLGSTLIEIRVGERHERFPRPLARPGASDRPGPSAGVRPAPTTTVAVPLTANTRVRAHAHAHARECAHTHAHRYASDYYTSVAVQLIHEHGAAARPSPFFMYFSVQARSAARGTVSRGMESRRTAC